MESSQQTFAKFEILIGSSWFPIVTTLTQYRDYTIRSSKLKNKKITDEFIDKADKAQQIIFGLQVDSIFPIFPDCSGGYHVH